MQTLWISRRLGFAAFVSQAIVSGICDMCMRSRRLHLPGSVIPMLLHHRPEVFFNLTHLQVDRSYRFKELSLPSLTHLIILNHAPANNGHSLCPCQPFLTAVLLPKHLVVCRIALHDEIVARADCRDVEDPRFVVMTTTRHLADDWRAEYYGQKNLFALAEDLVRHQVVSTPELTV